MFRPDQAITVLFGRELSNERVAREARVPIGNALLEWCGADQRELVPVVHAAADV